MAEVGKTAIERTMERDLEIKLDGPVHFTPDPLQRELQRFTKNKYVYVFSLFPKPKAVSKGSLGTFTIPACEAGARVSQPVRLPYIVSSSYFDAASQSMKVDNILGKYLAQDIVHPYLGGDWSIGQNLDDLGIFWTENEEPTEKEIATARTKLEGTYRKALAEATRLETTDQLEFITPLMRLAATYFKEDRPWNRMYRKLEVCPICGGDVRAGVVVHSCGAVMPGKWKEAILSGVKTRAQAEDAGVDLDKLFDEPKGKQAKGNEKPPSAQ